MWDFKKIYCAVIMAVLCLMLALVPTKVISEPYIGLGTSVVNSELKTNEFGYRWGDWDLSVNLQDGGNTKNGYQKQVDIVSFSKIIRPKWAIGPCDTILRVGVANVNNSALVGQKNFRLGAGCDFGPIEVEWSHISSADINKTNTGIDVIQFRLKI